MLPSACSRVRGAPTHVLGCGMFRDACQRICRFSAGPRLSGHKRTASFVAPSRTDTAGLEEEGKRFTPLGATSPFPTPVLHGLGYSLI